jgi:hypothetical protein
VFIIDTGTAMQTVTAHSRPIASHALPRVVRTFLAGARKLIALAGAPYLEGGLPPV